MDVKCTPPPPCLFEHLAPSWWCCFSETADTLGGGVAFREDPDTYAWPFVLSCLCLFCLWLLLLQLICPFPLCCPVHSNHLLESTLPPLFGRDSRDKRRLTTASCFPGLPRTALPAPTSPVTTFTPASLHCTAGRTQGWSSELSLKFYFLFFSSWVLDGTFQHRLHEENFS